MLPSQIAKDTHLRLSHISRALRELSVRGLIECLTSAAKGPGRLYGITKTGAQLVAYREASNRRFAPDAAAARMIGFVPKIRGASLVRAIAFLREARDRTAVREALKGWSVNADELTEDAWVSAEAYDEFLELLESKFGDGSYGFVRNLYRQVIPGISTVRQEIRRSPRPALVELAPAVYAKEWNYGRLVVETGRRQAVFRHFDWMPTPAFCAMFHGSYEGILRARTTEGGVTKTRCIRSGDDHCAYVARW